MHRFGVRVATHRRSGQRARLRDSWWLLYWSGPCLFGGSSSDPAKEIWGKTKTGLQTRKSTS